MKAQLVSLLITGLFTGAALAQTTTMPPKGSAVVTPPGAAQGRTPTAANTSPATSSLPQRDTAKSTGVTANDAMDKSKVISKPSQVQGSTKTAAKKAKSGGYESGAKMMDKDVKGPASAVAKTPAPGPLNTTPSAGPAGSNPQVK